MKTKWYGVIVAVIVLLLTSIGFAGVAAAADWSETTPSTLFYYENVTGLTGTYTNMNEALILDEMDVLDTVSSLPEGIYLNVNSSKTTEPAQIMLKKLDAEITMYVHDADGKIIYSGIGGIVPQGAKVSFKVNSNHLTLYTNNPYDSNKQYVGLKFIGPDGSEESTFLGTKNYGAVDNADRWGVQTLDSNLMEGTWTVWAYFVPLDKTGYFTSYTPDEYLNGQKYQFTILSLTPSMSGDRSSAKVGEYITVTISGKPNSLYYLKPNDKYEVNPGQLNYNYTSNLITIGKDGTTTLTLKAVDSGTFTLQLCSEDKKIVEEDLELTFINSEIPAESTKTLDISSGSTAFALGNFAIVNNEQFKVHADISNLRVDNSGEKLTLKADGLHDILKDIKFKSLTMKITSTGIDEAKSSIAVSTGFIPIQLSDFAQLSKGLSVTSDTEILGIKILDLLNNLCSVTFDVVPSSSVASVSLDVIANVEKGASINPIIELDISDVSKLHSTSNMAISLTSGGNKVSKSYTLDPAKEPIKQPALTITKSPEVLVQGENLEVIGTAEGRTNYVQYYLFGTNYFRFGYAPVDNGKFTIWVSKTQTQKEHMAAGQYFLVIQHPMDNNLFNVGAYTEGNSQYQAGDVVLNKYGSWNLNDGHCVVLFNTQNRQSANAAQALCDVLDSQDIDDMYVKDSFIVAGPTSYIDTIPSQITKGKVLTISGATTGHKGEVVIVELLSTAFAAIPRENLPPSVHYILTTTIGEDGVWSIPIDTSYMDADEYSCSVTVGQLGADVTKVTIVNAAVPTPTPTQTPGPVPTPMDALDISSGTAFLSLDPFELVGGYSAEACISISSITANPETRNIKVGLGNLQSLIQGLDMGYFRVSIVTNGIDAEKSRVTINSKYLTLDGGTIDSYGTGVTFGKNSVWNGVNLLDVEENTESVVFDIVPTSSNAEITIWVCSYIRSDKTLKPQIQISIDDVKTLKKNPNLYFSLSSGQNRVAGYCPLSISKIYPDLDDPTKLILKEGWNFVSVPKKLDAVNDTAAELFADVNTEGKVILSYNAESKLWETLQEDTKITPLNAYWIYSVDEITLKPVFNTIGSTPGLKTLKKGWNAVGLSAEEALPASIAFNGMNWRSYISWNTAGQKYDSPLVKGQSGIYGEENLVSLWKGGWVYMEEDGTYLGFA